MRIRMKIHIAGTFHGRPDGVQPGEVVDVEDSLGAQYCRLHYAEPVVDRKEEHAVAPVEAEERTEPDAPAKRGPGRPPKSQA